MTDSNIKILDPKVTLYTDIKHSDIKGCIEHSVFKTNFFENNFLKAHNRHTKTHRFEKLDKFKDAVLQVEEAGDLDFIPLMLPPKPMEINLPNFEHGITLDQTEYAMVTYAMACHHASRHLQQCSIKPNSHSVLVNDTSTGYYTMLMTAELCDMRSVTFVLSQLT